MKMVCLTLYKQTKHKFLSEQHIIINNETSQQEYVTENCNPTIKSAKVTIFFRTEKERN